jgi:hypothetical protein
LHPWFPLRESLALLQSDECQPGEAPLEWSVLDGVLGRLGPGDSPIQFPETETPDSASFADPREYQGVESLDVQEIMSGDPATRPNVLFYHGHVSAMLPRRQAPGARTCLFFHDSNPPDSSGGVSDYPGLGLVSKYSLPVPLLEAAPPQFHTDSVVVVSGCSSVSTEDSLDIVDQYLQKNSVFVGTSFPILSGNDSCAADVFLAKALRRSSSQYLAHALLQAQRFEFPVGRPDPSDLVSRAALCMFGDVRASLMLPPASDGTDSRPFISMRVVDRWYRGFRSLGLVEKRPMTYQNLAEAEPYPASDRFVLSDDGIQLTLAPLAPAIDLCRLVPGKYVLLGPAFSSRHSVAVSSKEFPSWDAVAAAIREAADQRRDRLKIGVVRETLTSTRMLVHFVLNKVIELEGDRLRDVRPEELIARTMEMLEFPLPGGTDTCPVDFLRTMDMALAVRGNASRVKEIGLNLLTDDLETDVAQLLGVGRLSRGVWLARSSSLEDVAKRTALSEFFDSLNSAIGERSPGDPFPVENPDDTPLPTFIRAEPADLEGIKLFAEQCVMLGVGEFRWENFACVPLIESASAVAALSAVGDMGSARKDGQGAAFLEFADRTSELRGELLAVVQQRDAWERGVLLLRANAVVDRWAERHGVDGTDLGLEVVDTIGALTAEVMLREARWRG